MREGFGASAERSADVQKSDLDVSRASTAGMDVQTSSARYVRLHTGVTPRREQLSGHSSKQGTFEIQGWSGDVGILAFV